jgi:hypothetical protein
MQQFPAYRASIITAMAAAAILMFAGLASAQAQSAERVVNGGTEVRVTSAPIPTIHRYRAAQWLLDMLPEEAPNTRNDEFVYDGDMIFLSIFWVSYIPIVMVLLWLIGDWLMRRFRKLRASFSSFISTHVQAEPRTATTNGGPNMRS